MLLFQPGAAEVHRKAGTWFDDQEIYEWFAANLHRVREPSLRHYVRAKELKAAGMDWTEVLAAEDENPRARLAAELLASAAYGSTAARVQAFVEQGGGCRATFFNYRRKLGGGNGTGGTRPVTLELLDDWIEEHEISDENVLGWYDYCSSIVYVAYHFMESYQEEPAYFSASHSYQAIYEREIIATLTRSIVEPEARLSSRPTPPAWPRSNSSWLSWIGSSPARTSPESKLTEIPSSAIPPSIIAPRSPRSAELIISSRDT